MQIETFKIDGVAVAVVSGQEKLITDARTALDLAMTVKYQTGAERIALPKDLVCDDFFVLSTGVAGEILQKFVNYHIKMAFYGEYSHYTSKPLRDFIYESNQGSNFFFVPGREEAIQKLTQAK